MIYGELSSTALQTYCQQLARAQEPQQALMDLKRLLSQTLGKHNLLLWSSRAEERDGVFLLAHINEDDQIIEPLHGLDIDYQTKLKINDHNIYELLNQAAFNEETSIQAKFIASSHGIVQENHLLRCYPTSPPNTNRYWWMLECQDNPTHQQFLNNNDGMLILLVNLLVATIHRCEAMVRVTQEKDWVHAELKQIANLQRLLLPQNNLSIRGIEITANFRACEHAGGDYYDIVNLSENFGLSGQAFESDYWGALIADSAGHGAAAAVEISMFDAILRTYRAPENDDFNGPANVFDYTNQYLFTRLIRGTFITSFAIGYHPERRLLSYSCAGHPPALLYRAKTQDLIELDQSGGIPLGVVREFEWENAYSEFYKDDILVLYTDGILEAENRHGEQFGKQRLIDLIMHHHTLPMESLLATIEKEIDHFSKGVGRKDDQTLVLARKTA